MQIDNGCFDEQGRINAEQFEPQAFKLLEKMLAMANRAGKRFIGAQYFLIGLAAGSPWFQQCVTNLGGDPARVLRLLETSIERGQPALKALELERLAFSEHVNLVLDEAWKLSENTQPRKVNDRHLTMAFMKLPETNSQRMMKNAGLDLVALQQEVVKEGEIVIPPLDTSPLEQAEGSQDLFSNEGQLNLELFDATAKNMLARAVDEAQQLGQLALNTAHIFLGMAQEKDSLLYQTLEAQGASPEKVCSVLRKAMHKLPPLPLPPTLDRSHITPNVLSILDTALAATKQAGGKGLIGDAQILKGLLSLSDSSTLKVIQQMGIRLDPLYDQLGLERPPELEAAAPRESHEAAAQGAEKSSLMELGRDLTEEALAGKLEPVLGRKLEIHRLVQTLVRQKKNNAILIGEAGVGKTAIVEGLAQRIAEGKVPPQLKGKHIIEIPISSLVAGTMYRGQFEERLEKIIKEAHARQVILFFDEIHTLVGAGQGSGGMLDAGNILKPALARGELHMIGATTPTEYARTIEKDAALERRFQPVYIDELSPEDTIPILTSLAEKYETYYNVRILPEAIRAAVYLSEKHLINRQLPDKAIDLLEETCSKANLSQYARSSGSFINVEETPEPVVVTPDMVSQMLSQMTGTPIPGYAEEDTRRLIDLESRLSKRVIGQDEAIQRTSRCIRVGRAGLRSQHRPIGVILFMGPSGVGKTWLATMVANEVFGSEDSLFRLDMSEFSEQHSVSKLLGSPPGYVGYESEGLLTGRLRHHPASVILLDEIEKAHPVIFDTLLQLFDAGRITDSQGRTANGENAIFILTSNLATKVTTQRMIGFIPAKQEQQQKKPVIDPDAVRTALGSFFRLEFLNRIDEIVIFNPLNEQAARQIVAQRLEEVSQQAQKSGIDIQFSTATIRFIVEKGFSQEFGARNLNRVIDNMINQPLSDLILLGEKGRYLCRVRSGHLSYQSADEQQNLTEDERLDVNAGDGPNKDAGEEASGGNNV